jgi:phage terminase small subunit
MTKKKTPAVPAKRAPAVAAPAPAPRTVKAKPRPVAKPAPVVVRAKPVPKPVPRKPVKKAALKPAKKTGQPLPAVVKQLSKAEQPKDKPLTPSEERFITEYLIDLNATQAYVRAYPGAKETSASVQSGRLLRNPWIAAKVALLKSERVERLQLDGDTVVKEIYAIGMADARELVEYRFTCCRHCYGKGFKLHRTQGERDRDFEKHEDKQDEKAFRALLKGAEYNRVVFDEKGGTGFNAQKPPAADCTECSGAGVGRVILKDTTSFGVRAAALYAGVKEGKDGLEVKMHSKLDALEKIMKHMGLYEADKEPVGMVFLGADKLDDIYREKMAEKERRAALIKGRAGRLNAADKGGQ